MTMLICYPSKKALKASIGQPLRYRETSIFGNEYSENGKITVAYRPVLWKHADGGREFFAQVTIHDNKIAKVD